MRPYLEKSHHKRAGRVAQGEGPELKLQYHKKKRKERKKEREDGATGVRTQRRQK
jgi:hypothetical protein